MESYQLCFDLGYAAKEVTKSFVARPAFSASRIQNSTLEK
jgi:hypothetical protein